MNRVMGYYVYCMYIDVLKHKGKPFASLYPNSFYISGNHKGQRMYILKPKRDMCEAEIMRLRKGRV